MSARIIAVASVGITRCVLRAIAIARHAWLVRITIPEMLTVAECGQDGIPVFSERRQMSAEPSLTESMDGVIRRHSFGNF